MLVSVSFVYAVLINFRLRSRFICAVSRCMITRRVVGMTVSLVNAVLIDCRSC